MPLGLLVVVVAGCRAGDSLLAKLPDGEELQDLVLDVLQSEMILFQNLGGALQVERLLHALVPWQLGHGFEVRPDHLRFHGIAARPLQAGKLTVDFLPGGLGELDGQEPLPQLLDLGGFIFFAQLLTDRLHLLAQQHLALALTQLLLDLRLDLFLRVGHTDLALDVNQNTPQPIFNRQQLEQGLAISRFDVEIARHEVGKAASVGHTFQHLLHHVFRKARLLAQLGGPLPCLAVQRDEGSVLGIQWGKLGGFADVGFEMALGVAILNHDAPDLPVQRKLDAPRATLHLADPRHGAKAVQARGRHGVNVLPLHHGENATRRTFERRFDGMKRRGTPRPNGGGDTREQHDVPEWQHGQSQFLTHERSRRSGEVCAYVPSHQHQACQQKTISGRYCSVQSPPFGQRLPFRRFWTSNHQHDWQLPGCR